MSYSSLNSIKEQLEGWEEDKSDEESDKNLSQKQKLNGSHLEISPLNANKSLEAAVK